MFWASHIAALFDNECFLEGKYKTVVLADIYIYIYKKKFQIAFLTS